MSHYNENKTIPNLDEANAIADDDKFPIQKDGETHAKFFTWANIKSALNSIYVTLTAFNNHSARHENGGADEISVAGLSGELADAQTPKAHNLGGAEHNADTLANLNSKVSDATLDDSGDSRPPQSHALGGSAHSADTLANLNSKVSDATLDDSGDPRDPNTHGNEAHSPNFATESALNTHINDTTNPHSVTQSQVGLGNVTNDAQLPLAGGTMTGNINMNSNKATNLANGTADGDAVNKGQLDDARSRAFFYSLPASGTLPIYRFESGATLTKVVFAISGGTNWVGQLQIADDAQGTNASNTQASDETVTGNTEVTTFSDDTITAGEYIVLKTTSVSGSVDWVHVTFYYD